MARIGIMTFLHNDNYGSILQAWALQNAVRSLGYDAEHIDYVPSQTEKMKNLLCSGNSPRLILDGMKKRSAARGLNEGFDEFRQTQMILSPICRDQSALSHQALSYDALICGSDQIWSPTWLNPAYFLNFTKKPKVAYAPSLGVSTMTDSAKGRKIAALIRGFAAISVREEEGAALLQALIGKKPAVMPDPVMLLPREKWLELIGGDIPMGNDILCFFLADNPAYWTQVEQIRQKTGLGVRVIPRTESALQSAYPLAKGVTPAQWLRLIAGASMVLTDSFHAAAFSLLLHTPCTVLRRYREDDPESRNSRVDQLLRTLQVADPTHPDFSVVDEQLASSGSGGWTSCNPPSVKQCRKRFRQRRGKRQPIPRHRVMERQGAGVQRKPPRQLRNFRAVEEIPDDRAADGRHMHADLERAPAFKHQFHQRARFPAFQHAIVRHRRLAGCGHDTADAGGVLLADGRVNHAAVVIRASLHHRLIRPDELRRMQKRLQAVLNMRVLGDNHQPACALIQPIHRTVDEIRRTAQMSVQRVFKCVVRVQGAGLARQRGGLVNHEQPVILMRNGQRQVIRLDRVHRRVLPEADCHHLPGAHKRIHRGHDAIHRDAAVPLGGLHRRVAHAHHAAQYIAQAHPVLLRQNHMFQQKHLFSGDETDE